MGNVSLCYRPISPDKAYVDAFVLTSDSFWSNFLLFPSSHTAALRRCGGKHLAGAFFFHPPISWYWPGPRKLDDVVQGAVFRGGAAETLEIGEGGGVTLLEVGERSCLWSFGFGTMWIGKVGGLGQQISEERLVFASSCSPAPWKKPVEKGGGPAEKEAVDVVGGSGVPFPVLWLSTAFHKLYMRALLVQAGRRLGKVVEMDSA